MICLAWVAVDLDGNVLRLKQRKTKHKVQVPIRPALRTLLVGLRSKLGKVNPSDPIWPEHAERYERLGAGPFSNEFYDLMASCGLVPARTHKVVKRAKSKAGSQSRQLTPISFHSLRHTFISLLRATGGNQAVAKELAGHSSDAVNDLYTHMPAETLQRAIAALPELSSS